MATIAEDLRTFLLVDQDITALVDGRVHQAKMPEQSRYPAVWFARAGRNEPLDLDGTGGLTQHRFDLECLSTDLAQAEDLADATWSYLHGHRGTFGTRSVQGVFLSDQDEDYIPRGAAGDDGIHAVAIAAVIWST